MHAPLGTHVPVIDTGRLRLRASVVLPGSGPGFGRVTRESLPREDAGDVVIRHDLRGAA